MQRERWLLSVLLLLLSGLALTACAKQNEAQGPASEAVVTVYKTATCGCCGKWAEHLQAAGFEVREVNLSPGALMQVKQKYGVPQQLYSCHTAVVEDYVIEGHVPAQEVQRLLAERPAVKGIGVPGMPLGSPGMETPDGTVQPYTVFSFDPGGSLQPFAQYP